MRTFGTGANRDSDTAKIDYEGHLSPTVLEVYGLYMHRHRFLADGSVRDSDNWQKGMPLSVYMKSLWRHFLDMWKVHRGIPLKEPLVFIICGILFNAMGYLHQFLKENPDYLTQLKDELNGPRDSKSY